MADDEVESGDRSIEEILTKSAQAFEYRVNEQLGLCNSYAVNSTPDNAVSWKFALDVLMREVAAKLTNAEMKAAIETRKTKVNSTVAAYKKAAVEASRKHAPPNIKNKCFVLGNLTYSELEKFEVEVRRLVELARKELK